MTAVVASICGFEGKEGTLSRLVDDLVIRFRKAILAASLQADIDSLTYAGPGEDCPRHWKCWLVASGIACFTRRPLVRLAS